MTELDKVFEKQNKIKTKKTIIKFGSIGIIGILSMSFVIYKLILSGVIQL